jgi:hypothetical protein
MSHKKHKPRKKHRRGHHGHTKKFLVVSFIEVARGVLTMKIFSNDPKGLNLTLQEILQASGQQFPLTKGPFQVDVTDPSGVITVTPGSADQSTPTNFKPNGTAAVGTVTAKVTDTSNGLVGSGSFDVVAPAPPPPPGPDTLVVGFVPA